MRDILELKDDLSHKIRTCEELLAKAESEGRVFTDEEKRFTEDLQRECKEIQAEIESIEDFNRGATKIREAAAAMRKPGARVSGPSDVTKDVPDADDRITIPATAHRYASLKAFQGKGADERAYASGQWLRATFFGSHLAKRWCNEHGINVHNALSEGTNTAGGYLVPDEMSQAIIDLREQYGVFRRYAEIMPMGRDVMDVPKWNTGITAAFVAEAGTVTESDPSWGNVKLVAKKLGIITRMSSELAEDAIINMADKVAFEMGYAFALKEDQCGFIGDGSDTYGGITGVCTKFENNTSLAGAAAAATTSHDTFAEIDAADLATCMAKLPQYATVDAAWYCSRVAYSLMFERLAAAAGGNSVQSLSGAFQPSYLGYPIRIVQVMRAGAATDQTGLVMALFGDLRRAAMLGDRRGIEVAQSRDAYFTTDQIGLRAIERLDINVHGTGDNTTAGPIVALLGGSA